MPQQTASKKQTAKSDAQDNMYVAALSYLGPLCFVPLFLKRDSAFAQSHAQQGLILFVAEVIGMFLYWFPLLGQLLFLSFIIASAYGIMITLKGEEWEIPIIGKYAGKLNL